MPETPAHRQQIHNAYAINYPAHEPREKDPHYVDFHAWKKQQKAKADAGDKNAWRCAWAVMVDDDSECDSEHPLEAHHAHIEFALANAIDLAHLEHIYPGVSNPDEVGAWIESDENLVLLCVTHHRSQAGGVHHLAAADYEASRFLRSGTIVDSK